MMKLFIAIRILTSNEAIPGYISNAAAHRAMAMLGLQDARSDEVARTLGQFATRAKRLVETRWRAKPTKSTPSFDHWRNGGQLELHGMAQVAYDDRNLLRQRRISSPACDLQEKLLASV